MADSDLTKEQRARLNQIESECVHDHRGALQGKLAVNHLAKVTNPKLKQDLIVQMQILRQGRQDVKLNEQEIRNLGTVLYESGREKAPSQYTKTQLIAALHYKLHYWTGLSAHCREGTRYGWHSLPTVEMWDRGYDSIEAALKIVGVLEDDGSEPPKEEKEEKKQGKPESPKALEKAVVVDSAEARRNKRKQALLERKDKDTLIPAGEDGKNPCTVCEEREVATTVVDCGHSYMCYHCALLEPATCAICNEKIIEGVMAIFKA